MNLYRHIDRSKIQFDFLVYHQEEGSYDKEINRLGGKIYRIPHLRDTIAHKRAAHAFFCKHPEYKIVHNHMQSNGALIVHEAKKVGVPVLIYHSHSGPVPLIEEDFKHTIRRIMRCAISNCTWKYYTDFIACGVTAARAIPKKNDVLVLNNAIDVDQFKYNATVREEIRKETNCDGKLVIGNIARIDENKNQLFAVKVLEELLNSQPNTELWLVGDGITRKYIEDYVMSKGLNEKVRFFGVRNDIPQLLQAMDVFIFPSIREGLPVACIEAQAAGLPCVISDGIDHSTIITDNCTMISLNDTIKNWSKAIGDYRHFVRKDTTEVIKAAGYDIYNTAKQIQSFYLSKDGN